ncbi:MAG: di-trans,poly-cis-decaprenylcistransferase [Armatimonadetes bacterium]|nr:di-trans,poly-cis-decaprenylcistransferase [Armatimonadota bacterium]
MRRRRTQAQPTDGELGQLARIDANRLPTHIAMIMDGNGRWARQRHMPRTYGHLRGAEAVERVIRCCRYLPDRLREAGLLDGEPASRIRYLTLYSFSSENWSRPREEVNAILSLIEQKLREKLDDLLNQGVRIRMLGRDRELPESLRTEFQKEMEVTAGCDDLTVYLAVNYGGRQEIIDAALRMAEAIRGGQLAPEQVDERMFGEYLYAPDVPDPELLVRTGGELRVSNFLLWQIAYSEMWVTPTLWPALSAEEFYRALADYQSRERRFGGLNGNGQAG